MWNAIGTELLTYLDTLFPGMSLCQLIYTTWQGSRNDHTAIFTVFLPNFLFIKNCLSLLICSYRPWFVLISCCTCIHVLFCRLKLSELCRLWLVCCRRRTDWNHTVNLQLWFRTCSHTYFPIKGIDKCQQQWFLTRKIFKSKGKD